MPENGLQDRLSNLLAVTDVRLTRLDVDDLLVELLDRLRAILEADTAAVLLRQNDSDELIARAACGLEEEVRQGVRVPIGVGFAGTIAAQAAPVILDRVDATTVANPILWEKGIRRMLGVPLLSGDSVFGVLHVGRLADRSFDEHDVELLQLAADRVASAIDSRRLAVESAAGAILERELLPTRLPTVPGLHFAARYAPAEDRSVGGDWYDAFVLPTGEVYSIIGDVAGHGLNSAVIVGRVKSALRSYALLGVGPSRVMELTNQKLLHFEVNTMVTALIAVAAPPFDHVEICSAGHPPPVLATADESTLVSLTPGPPLGALNGARYHSFETKFPRGATMLFYTDGLVERRGESVDVGLDRLRRAVKADTAEAVCRDVMLRLIGTTTTTDDVAMLAMEHVSWERSSAHDAEMAGGELIGEVTLPGRRGSVAQARAFSTSVAGDLNPRIRGTLQLLVSEIATNCVVHAETDFIVRLYRGSQRLRVECSDHGGGTVEVRHPGPTDTHGRGMYFVLQLADDWGVRTSYSSPGKTVWFTLRTDAAPAALDDTGLTTPLRSGVHHD